jgi:spore coat polysaccharide biosynthesis protein SpsF
VKVTCTIESRISSTRLPGKALYPFYDTTILGSVIANARAARLVDRVIVCTSLNTRDEIIADYAAAAGVDVFRGDEDNVAGRIAEALADQQGANVFLTGDNPAVTSDLIDLGIEQFLSSGADYLCSTHMKYCDWWHEKPALPKGLSVQVSDTSFFRDAVIAGGDPHFLQHSTMVMYGHRRPGRKYMALTLPFSAKARMDFSYTIDTPSEYLNMIHRWPSRPMTLREVLEI